VIDRRQILLKAYKLYDLLVMSGSFALATWVSFYYEKGIISFDNFLSMRVKVQNFLLFLGFLWVWHLAFSCFGLYHSRRLSSRSAEIVDLIKATSLGTLLIFLVAILFKIHVLTPIFVIALWTLTTTIVISSRLILRYGLGKVRIRGRNLRHMLLVGTNQRAIQFARKIEAKPELGYRIVGFVDEEWPGTEEFRKAGYVLVANFHEFSAYLRNHVVDEVVISLPVNSCYQQACQVVALCEEQGIIVRYLSDIFNSKLTRSKAEYFEGEPLISRHIGAMEGWQILVKRTMDIALSSFLLLFLLPLFLVTAFLIKITSPGPVFFVQERVGLNKRRFTLCKFRTMIADSEKKQSELKHLNEVSGPVFKIKDDPRITWIGKFLRKTSIDELPQLINVLRGDMSLVGPRPLPVRDYTGFYHDWHRRRFSVRPGITCLWQVGGRSSIPFEKWMELDMEYIDRWSLWLDLKILAKTIPAVLKSSGAA
jgi:exopolysaccharide biosynthesis polyprenyl glycosylphosphotransferase